MAPVRRLERPLQRVGTRVAVASDQALVAESVRAVLVEQGYDAVLLRWPGSGPLEPDSRRSENGRPPKRRAGHKRPDVALLMCGLDQEARIREAQSLIEELSVPWLVLARLPRGPAWGAVLESGAEAVVPTTTGLGEVTKLIDDLGAGRHAISARRRRELVREWRQFTREREETATRFQSLTKREEEVLRLLHAGETVRTIAEQSEVTEATVRSQVKAILRKLNVNSQIAAVANYELIRTAELAEVGG